MSKSDFGVKIHISETKEAWIFPMVSSLRAEL
jgi:hypothetical protein